MTKELIQEIRLDALHSLEQDKVHETSYTIMYKDRLKDVIKDLKLRLEYSKKELEIYETVLKEEGEVK